MLLKKVCVLAILLTGTLADLDTNQQAKESRECARTCKYNSKFNYVPGTTHEFEYNVQTETSMTGASSNRASLGIQATAGIEVLSRCEMVLMLHDVKVHRSDPSPSKTMENADGSGEFKRNLERSPLRFSFQDGVIEELCPAEGETTWALNIKRGLLTAVQNSMDNIDRDQSVFERDVTGECQTHYKVIPGWFSSTIIKTKDLLGCTERNGYHSSVHGMQYRVPSEIQSLPLMKSTHECEQELDGNGLLKSALIRETHTFRPFSRATSGATTKVLQRLKYKTQISGVTTRKDEIRNRVGMTFEYAHGQGNKDQPMRDAESKLREICQNTRSDIRPDTPRFFSELVYIIKSLSFDDIKRIYEQVKSGSTCTANSERVKKLFLDTIPMANTGASVTFLKDILLKGEVIGAQATMWITSLSLIHYPTVEMLQEVKALLDTHQYSKAAMLPVSTMVNNYCNHHEDCSVEYTITNIISTMEKTIGYGCYIRDSSLETSLVALRALGNAGHLDRLTTTLSSCFNRQANPTEVRVAAIQAFRRLPCTADRNEAMAIYQDSDEEPELRISAYLAVMQCPSEDVLSRIQASLESEKTLQVGSLIWSHLTNLMETSSPQKQTIRRILEDKTLGRTFDLSILKYSRNYEGSVFLEKFNTGAMLESNVILSDKSFFPRSAMFNLTVDLFGSSLNLLEVGGRAEGVEYLIEKYLSQYSFLRDWFPPKEMVSDNITDFKGDMYMKIFGNEMYYDHFSGVDPIASVKNFDFLDFFAKMSKKQDYSFTQNMMILDSSMITPTSSGLPLSLNVNGTASIDLQASGQVDLRNILTSPRSLLIDGLMKPSGSIQITGTMAVDAFVTKTGLRVVNTWHSSTALKGRVELRRGKILSADIDLPQQKMEILDVSTEFFNIHGDLEEKQDLVTGNRKKLELCTGGLTAITGLEICNEFQWPSTSMVDDAPYFPFTGPFSQSLVLYKRDVPTGYKIMAKQSGNKKNTFVQFNLKTPGSRTDRTIDVQFSLKRKTNEFEMKALTPWKEANLKGSMTSGKKNIGLKGQMTVDKSSEYIVMADVGKKRKRSAVTYTPRLEIRRPRGKVIQLSGTVETEVNKKVSVELTLKGVTTHPVNLKSYLVNSESEKSLKGTFSLVPEQDYLLQAGYVYQAIDKKTPVIKFIPTLTVKTPKRELVYLKGAWEYKGSKSLQGSTSIYVHNILNKPISIQCDMHQTSGKKTKHSAKVIVRSEFMDVKVIGNVESTKKTVSPTIVVEYTLPKAYSSWSNKHSIKSKLTSHNTKPHLKSKLQMDYRNQERPHLNVFLKSDFSHSTRHTKADVTIRYGVKVGNPEKHITGSASIDHHVNKRAVNVKYKLKTEIGPMDVSFDIQGKYSGNSPIMGSELVANYRKHTGFSSKNPTVSTSVACRVNTNAKKTAAVVEIKTQHDQLKYLNAEVNHDHETKVASSVGSFSTGSKGNRMTYRIKLQMPSKTHNGLELSASSDRRFEFKFHHVGDIFNFKTKGNLLYDEGKNITGAISFLYNDQAHIGFEAEMTTPFEGFENIIAQYQHSFSKSQAALSAELTNGFSTRATCMFSLNATNGRLAMSLKTPSRNNLVSFTYTGPLKNCEGKSEIQMLGYSNLVHIVYIHGHKIRVVLASNNKSRQVLKVSFYFELTPTMLNSSALYTFKGSTFEGVVVGVKEGDRRKIVLELRTPFQDFRETGLSYQYYKDWRNQYAAVRYMDGKEITFNSTHYSKYKGFLALFPDSILSLIELRTPFRNWEILSFRFEGRHMDCGKGSTNTTIMYGNYKKITIDSYVIDKDPVGPSITFLIKTPFEKYETNKVVINCVREGLYVNGRMDIRISDIVSTLHYTGKIDYKEGNMTLHTNFHGYELMEGGYVITYINRLYNATSTFSLNNETVRTEFITDWKNDFHSHLTIWTPAENFRNIGFTYDHNHSGYMSELHIRYKDNKVITYILTYFPRINGSHSYKFELITPITGYERQHILYTDRSKGRKNFNKIITFLTSSGEQLTLSSDCVLPSFVDVNVFYKSKEIEGHDLVKLLFISPSVENVTVKIGTKLPFESFGTCLLDYHHFIDNESVKGALKLERNGTTYIATNLNGVLSTDNFHGSASIKSDVYHFHNMTVALSKEGTLKNVRAKGLILVDDSIYETSLSHVIIPGKLRKVGGELILNWDRKHPGGNLQVQAKLMDRRAQSLFYRDITLKFIHPTRTAAIIGNVLSSQRQTKSHGEFMWNEAEGPLVFYDLDVMDHSRRYSKMFKGTFKVGSHLRNLQMGGSYIQTGLRNTLDGDFYWDSDRDDSKKIGMKAECTFRDRNKHADLSLRLPSLGKNIKVNTRLLLNDGRTVFNGKTQLSYSDDDRKTITLTSSMDDISYGYGDIKYRFMVGISHPYTDVDVKLTSHIGSSSEQVSAWIDMSYLTARGERRNFALDGQFNKTMQMLKLNMHCPVKDVEASVGFGGSPFKVVINNRTLSAALPTWKAVEFETHFDPDDPGKMLHVNARYVNSSAMQAEVYHLENFRRIFDSLVALRLNTSRLLHIRISWRPQMIADVQAYLTRKLERYGRNAKATLDSVYRSLGEELSDKYHRIAQATKEELPPYLSLLVSEMTILEKQLDSIRTDIKSMHKRNDFYLADIGDYPDAAEKLYRHLVKTISGRLIRGCKSMREHLQNANDLNVKEIYDDLLYDWVVLAKEKVDTTLEDVVEVISIFDDMIENMWDAYQHHYNIVQRKATATVDTIVNLPSIVDNKLEISNSISPYMNRLYSTTVRTYDSFKDMVKNSGDIISSHLIDAEQRSDLQMLVSITNNIYEDTGTILEDRLQKIPELLKREVMNYTRDTLTMYSPKSTVWDPDNGEIQVELSLPIPFRALDTLPDLQQYVLKAKTTVNEYIPAKSTLTGLYKKWRSNKTKGA